MNTKLVKILWAACAFGLLATAMPVGALDLGASAPKSCSWDDHSAGVGGQGGGCVFSCTKNGYIDGSIYADDKDAGVSLKGNCGGGSFSCSGTQTCGGSDGPVGDGDGACSGSSQEAIDSGLSFSCSSSSGDRPLLCVDQIRYCVGGDPPPIPTTSNLLKLVLGIVGGIQIHGDLCNPSNQASTGTPQASNVNLERVCSALGNTQSHSSSVSFEIAHGVATARRCQDGVCVPATAIVQQVPDGSWVYSVLP